MKIKISNSLDHINDRGDLLQDFIIFVSKDLQCMPCDVDIVNGRSDSGLTTTAQYDPNNHHITVNGKNRQFGDVLRSVAHEMVHHKQNVNGELDETVQDVGGNIEDEANARAGELLKSFAYQSGPERIYEQIALPDPDKVIKDALKEKLMQAGQYTKEMRNWTIERLKKAYKEFATQDIPKVDDEIRDSGVAEKSYDKDAPSSECTFRTHCIPGSDIDIRGNGVLYPPLSFSRVTSDFGWREMTNEDTGEPEWKNHEGIDISGSSPGYGYPVSAGGEGVVYSRSRDSAAGPGNEGGGWVDVNYRLNKKRIRVRYGHLGKISVSPNDIVVHQTTLGSTGAEKQVGVPPHVHVEVFVPSAGKDTDEVYGETELSWTRIDPRKVFKLPKAPKAARKVKPTSSNEPEPEEVLMTRNEPEAESMTSSEPEAKETPMTSSEPEDTNESVLESYIKSVILEANDAESKENVPDPKKKLDIPVKSRITKSKAIDIDSEDKSSLDPVFKSKVDNVISKLVAHGYRLKIVTAYRSPKTQSKKYKAGHSKVKVSKHNALTLAGNEVVPASKALDLIWNSRSGAYSTKPKNILYYKRLGKYAEDEGLRWGGNFKKSNPELEKHKIGWDPTHIELASTSTRQVAIDNKDLISKTIATPSSGDARLAGDPEPISNIAESIDILRSVVRESLTTYGVGHTDPTNGGPGHAYKLGVDYKNASTNIPHVGTGYVDRTHSLPYEVRLRTNQDAKQIYDTVFADGINTAAMNLTPDQVVYNPDGLRLQCHIATGQDAADERDVKLISQEIYKSMMGSPGKAEDAIFDIEVEPVNTKIRR